MVTMREVILAMLTVNGATESDDIKHACRMEADDYNANGYISAIFELFRAGQLIRVSDDYSTNPVFALV